MRDEREGHPQPSPGWRAWLLARSPAERARLRVLEAWALVLVLGLAQVLAWLPWEPFGPLPGWLRRLWLGLFLLQAASFHLGLLLLPGALVAGYLGRRRLALAATLVAGLCLLPFLPEFLPRRAPPPSPEDLVLRVANVFNQRLPSERSREELLAGSPDVLVLVEYTPAWQQELSGLATHPHRWTRPRSDAFGLAVYSRVPFVRNSLRVLPLSDHDLPQLSLELDLPGGPLELVAIHTLPPRTLEYTVHHVAMVRRLLAYLDQRPPGPLVLAGDFNFSLRTDPHRALLRRGLIDAGSRAGSGLGDTWPVLGPLRSLPGIRLDHVYLGGGVDCVSLVTGEGHDSDHRPLTARLRLPAP